MAGSEATGLFLCRLKPIPGSHEVRQKRGDSPSDGLTKRDKSILQASQEEKTGVLYALFAFAFWGLVPIYFKAVDHVSPLEVVAHRVLWSVPVTALLITLNRDWRALRQALSSRKVLATLFLTAVLVATNWFLFIYAVTTNRVLDASLGYYINPLVNVLLGIVFLKERLKPLQLAAVLLAAAGTTNLTIHHGRFPWIALVLGITFGFYGLLRKTVRIESVNGLFVETGLVSPFALGCLVIIGLKGTLAFGTVDWETTLLLLLAGAVTTFPLVSFTAGARRIRYSTLGLLQYLGPTIMFLLAVFLYNEAFTLINLITFCLIWTALALFAIDSLYQHRGAAKQL
ncbi:MAG: EamA family transporter RarD [Proteobacteria bacterium]|nr:EamA family transporter RarD [Pseudomonadota bacterium]